jgi:osmotically-inducible protein OsmY
MTESGWVSPQDVAVTVRHGVVILEGTVDNDGERAAAAELSYRAGARGVINRLEVRAQQPRL